METLRSVIMVIAIFGPALLGLAYLIHGLFFNGGKGVFNTLKDDGDLPFS